MKKEANVLLLCLLVVLIGLSLYHVMNSKQKVEQMDLVVNQIRKPSTSSEKVPPLAASTTEKLEGCKLINPTELYFPNQKKSLILSGKSKKALSGDLFYHILSIKKEDNSIVILDQEEDYQSFDDYSVGNDMCSPDGQYLAISLGIDVGFNQNGVGERTVYKFINMKDTSTNFPSWNGEMATSDTFLGWIKGEPHTIRLGRSTVAEPDK
ncbi:MAG: hypothetical protein JWN37_1 [Candidatus Nomurabacteria bacterium]|nr:hypothetical protein [Candidatus Nomurabacteria bacterium]